MEKSRVRRRPVSFGNPALGTYGGYVYTFQTPHSSHGNDDEDKNDDDDGNESEDWSSVSDEELRDVETSIPPDRLVAMVDVPPEQVPEGILTFARSHRPNVEHVRIAISTPETKVARGQQTGGMHLRQSENNLGGGTLTSEVVGRHPSLSTTAASLVASTQPSAPNPLALRGSSGAVLPASPAESAVEAAATILAADEAAEVQAVAAERERHAERQRLILERRNDLLRLHEEEEEERADGQQKTYLVLFGLTTPSAAEAFVNDLDGRPYTSLEEDVVCRAFRVAGLKGVDGVPLMSPFFEAAKARTGSSPASGGSAGRRGGAVSPGGASGQVLAAESGESAALASVATNVATTAAVAELRRRSPPSEASSPTAVVSSPAAEVHNCAVCLERMDLTAVNNSTNNSTAAAGGVAGTNVSSNTAFSSNTSGWQAPPPSSTSILTTVCNHSFHIDCLLRWQDSPCPVCRYDHSGLNEALSQCHVCGTTENNYVCLICGVVSCGGGGPGGPNSIRAVVPHTSSSSASTHGHCRSSTAAQDDGCASSITGAAAPPPSPPRHPFGGHAREHYDSTLHAYALDTETQHVWDFAGQGYVHRLLQNAEDGKLVEVSDPRNTTSEERSLSPGLSDAQEGEVVHRKLEGYASQYYALLKSQLEQQRIYYEGKLEEIRRGHGRGCGVGRDRRAKTRGGSTADLIAALKQDRNQIEQRCVTLRRKYEKVSEDVKFLRHMNESLEANKAPMKRKIAEAQREREEARNMILKCLPPLQEKLEKLMLQFEGGETDATDCVGVDGGGRREGRGRRGSAGDDRKPAARRK